MAEKTDLEIILERMAAQQPPTTPSGGLSERRECYE